MVAEAVSERQQQAIVRDLVCSQRLSRDKVETLVESLGVTADELQAVEDGVAAEVDAAVAFAEAGTPEALEELTRFVYSDSSSVGRS